MEAIQSAQSLAVEYSNQQIEQVHLLYALLEQEEGLLPQLLMQMGVDAKSLAKDVERAVTELPRVSGPGREADKVYVSRESGRGPQPGRKGRRADEGRIHLRRAPGPWPDRAAGQDGGRAVPALRRAEGRLFDRAEGRARQHPRHL